MRNYVIITFVCKWYEVGEADCIPSKLKKANRPRKTRNEAIILPFQFVTVTTLLRSATHLSEKRKASNQN